MEPIAYGQKRFFGVPAYESPEEKPGCETAGPEEQEIAEKEKMLEQERRDTLERQKELEKNWKNFQEKSLESKMMNGIYAGKRLGKTGKISMSLDAASAAQLQSRLKGAATGSGVRTIISSASNAISAYKLAAALDPKNERNAYSEIARLERVIQNAGTKIKRLSKEEELQDRQKKAELTNRWKKAERLKEELIRRKSARKLKESAERLPGESPESFLRRRENRDCFRRTEEEGTHISRLEDALADELQAADGLQAEPDSASPAGDGGAGEPAAGLEGEASSGGGASGGGGEISPVDFSA